MSAIIATVTAVKGEVFVRLANGTLKHLHQGDAIHEGEQVVTSTGANVELAYQDGRQVQIAEQHTLTVDAAVAALDKPDSNESAFFADTSDADKVLAALERGDDLSTLLEAPAAGLSAGGGDDGGSGFVRLLRIVEGVDPLSFAFTAAATSTEEQVTTAATDELNGELTAVADSTQLLESATATTQSGNLINNDLFPSNRSVVVSQIDGTSFNGQITLAGNYGSLAVAADGSYTYTLDPAKAASLVNDQQVNEVFNYTLSNGIQTSSANLTVNITGINNIAVVNTSSTKQGSVTEDNPAVASGTVIMTDADAGQSGVIAETINDKYGSFAVNSSGQWTYTLDSSLSDVQGLKAGETLVREFTVTSTDGGTSQMVTIEIRGSNDGPVALDNSGFSVEEGSLLSLTPAQLLGNDTDVDGDALSIRSVQGASHGTVAIVAGNVVFTPDANYNGPASFTYTISDGHGGTSTATVNLNVTPVDDPSVLTADSKTVAEDTVATGNVLSNDNDVDSALSVTTFSVNGTTYNAGQTATLASGTLTIAANGDYTFNPAANWNGDMPQATYSTNTGSSSTLDIKISPVNDASVLTADSQTVNEDTSATGNVLSNDNDVDSALSVDTFSVDGSTYNAGQTATLASGTLTIAANGDYTFNPAANWNGDMPQATYSTNTGSTSTLDIKISPVNDASVLAADSQTVNEDTSATGNVLSNDSDVDNVLSVTTFSVNGTTYNAGQTATLASGTLTIAANGDYTFNPAANWNGDMPQATYSTNTGSSSTLDIKISPVNDAPIAVLDSFATTKDTPLTLTANLLLQNDTDVDHDSLVITSVQDPKHGTVEIVGGKIVFTPDATYTGSNASFTYTIEDGNGGTSTATAELTINPMPVTTLTSSTSTITGTNFGLAGEYFGYNDNRTGTLSDPSYSGNLRQHSDDGTADAGAANNLDVIADIENLVEGRNSDTSLVGSARVSQTNAADATFSANKMEFGLQPGTLSTLFGNGLGTNNKVTSGNTVVAGNNLNTFLKVSSGNADSLVATSGVGHTSDAAIRMVGYINIPAGGLYDIRVSADDGFRILIGGQNVAEVNANQAPRTTTHNGVTLAEGLQSIEILYWDQGGQASFRVEVKESGAPASSYKIIGNEEFALFAPSDVPHLTNTQDIVETSNGVWAVREGETFTGTFASEQINGSDGRDAIHGGAGNDIIQAGAGSDLIHGGVGNDTMTGGQGSDVFMWELADKGSTTLPNKDVISDFNTASKAAGGDVLDLRDLLQGESQTLGNLGNYLHFEKVGSDTIVHVSSTGGYSSGFNTSHDDLQITLSSVDLTASNTLSDATILQQLINQGKLISD